MTEEPLRIGILGVARISGEAIILPAQALGHRLVAVASRDPARARFFADLCGVERVHPDYDALLADPDIDVVYLPLPTALHTRWALAAIAAGKHVLCEKPLAMTAAQAQAVRAAADAAGVRAHEAYHHLCHPLYDRIRALLDGGSLGPIRRVEARLRMRPPAPDDPRWSAGLGGGALLDLGCYGLQAHHWLGRWAGAPRVSGSAAVPRSGVDAEAEVRLRFPSGAIGLVHCSMIAADNEPHTLRIECARGTVTAASFVLPHLGGALTVSGPGSAGHTATFDAVTTYEHQLRRFAELVRAGRPMPADLGDAEATAALLEAARSR